MKQMSHPVQPSVESVADGEVAGVNPSPELDEVPEQQAQQEPEVLDPAVEDHEASPEEPSEDVEVLEAVNPDDQP